jgi:hypothetical protein
MKYFSKKACFHHTLGVSGRRSQANAAQIRREVPKWPATHHCGQNVPIAFPLKMMNWGRGRRDKMAAIRDQQSVLEGPFLLR